MRTQKNSAQHIQLGNYLAGAPVRAAVLLVATLQLLSWTVAAAPTSPSYATSNAGIKNIQASSAATAGATDKNSNCVGHARYSNHRGESWIAVDPSNPSHLVGMSKFFFDPLFYLFHLGSYASFNGGKTWSNEVIPGFDCQSAPAFTWVNTTDPILAFDANGVVYSTMLPYSLTYNSAGNQVWSVIPNSAISVVKSTDGGITWRMGNQGQPLAIYNSSGLGRTADKQWMTADANPNSPFAGDVYVGWTLFAGFSSELWFSRSTDHGEHFSTPVQISFANNDGPFNSEFPILNLAFGANHTPTHPAVKLESTWPVLGGIAARSGPSGLCFLPPACPAADTCPAG